MSAQLPLPLDWCLRWRDGRHSWRRRSDGGFDSRLFDVAPTSEGEARAYVVRHHYSRSYPGTRLRYGLFRRDALVGVAVLSVPVRAEVLTGVFPGLTPYQESLELGRFVLDDAVPANGESWFLARVWELAAADGVRGVVSFSDPVPRTTAAGRPIFPGHVGTIYQASNSLYLGRGRARTLKLLPDGTVLNDRSVAKVAAQDRGHEYVERQLVALGARRPGIGEDMRAWLGEALARVGVRRLAHGGNHRYAFALGNPAERRAIRADLRRRALLPYPKRADRAA